MCLYLCNMYILAPSNARTLRGCEKWHPFLSVWHPLGGPVDEHNCSILLAGVALLWEIVVNAYPPTFCWCFEFHCHLDSFRSSNCQTEASLHYERVSQTNRPPVILGEFGDGILHRVACQILLGLLNFFSSPRDYMSYRWWFRNPAFTSWCDENLSIYRDLDIPAIGSVDGSEIPRPTTWDGV